MDKKIMITVNGRKVFCDPGESVLKAALRHGIEIPHFCHHDDLPTEATCRTCLVEIVPTGKVTTSCDLRPAAHGLAFLTDSPAVQSLRKENLELLLAGHRKFCPNCRRSFRCKTAELMKRYKVTGAKYSRYMLHLPIHKMCNAAEFDPQACILCRKCIEMCQKTGIGFLRLEGKASQTRLAYSQDPGTDCIYCGQCTVHCPVGAVREQSHIEEVERALKDKNKIKIVQMAPSVRVSIGEEFGLPPGTDVTGKMYAAFRRLGFDKIFDTNMGADITTWVEAEELAERINGKGKLPMFTSCCPAWVKYAEFYHPEMLPYLTTARPPQIHAGGAYKTWWAKLAKLDPKRIVVVSVMPCTSKKYEARHEKLKINGLYPVDFVLTTRETANLLKKHKIDLPRLKSGEADSLGFYSGAGAIYGASGGVMESALRTAHFFLTGRELKKVDFKAVRGMQGVKRATVRIGKTTLKVAVVAMAKNAKTIIEEVKRNPRAYDYIEVMACPGGCIGGGGQPIPTTEALVAQRIRTLYKIDSGKKLRKAHLNPVVRDFMKNYIALLPRNEQKKILHTSYTRKKKFE